MARHEGHHDDDHIVSPTIYVVVLLGLMALLVLTVIAASIDLDAHFHRRYVNLGVALAIAIAKAVLIILFFMHVKYSSRLVWAFASAAFVWLGIMMTLSLSDYLTRDYPEGTPTSPPEAGPELRRSAPNPDTVVPGASAAPLHAPSENTAAVRITLGNRELVLPPPPRRLPPPVNAVK